MRFADRSINLAGTIAPPLIHVGLGKEGMSAAQARELIAALAEALDQLDGGHGGPIFRHRRQRWPVAIPTLLGGTDDLRRRESNLLRPAAAR